MENILLSPPAVFLIILVLSFALAGASSALAYKRKGDDGSLSKAYACGEEVEKHRVQPDYSQFFPFAFFFTILHVVSLVIATVPTENLGSFVTAVIYIFGTILGLTILFRRQA